MSCPTCDHTLGRLTGAEDMAFFNCERCGTVVVEAHDDKGGLVPGFPRHYVPKLVERCREFAGLTFSDLGAILGHLHRLGILESIYLPENRP